MATTMAALMSLSTHIRPAFPSSASRLTLAVSSVTRFGDKSGDFRLYRKKLVIFLNFLMIFLSTTKYELDLV